METVFIKEVHPNGPAYFAGLQQGDRLLKVNNMSIAGVPYSTIVYMIKQTPNVLTLHVVPKECDVLQLVSILSPYQQTIRHSNHKLLSSILRI